MAAIIIHNSLPAELVALTQETIEHRDRLIDEAIEYLRAPITEATHAAAAVAYKACGKLKVAVEKERKRLKAPVLDLGRALDDAAEEATGPLADVEAKLAKHIREYERVREEQRAAEERRRMAEAQRLQDEADARAEQERQRAQEEAEANALPDEPVPVVPVTAHLPVRVEPVPLPPAPKSAVNARLKPHLVIDDISKVPFTHGNVRLWAELDEQACLVLIQAGAQIPGLRVEMREELRRSGGRA